jgi:hypothetical protein
MVLVMFALVWGMSQPGSAEDVWPDLSRTVSAQGGGDNDAVLIVAIENYASAPPVPGASQNATDWASYFTDVRWVPPESVRLLRGREATLERMRRYANETSQLVKPGGTLWFVFIGHGAPTPDGRDGVMVGYDAQQEVDSLYARSIPQQELFGLLSRDGQVKMIAIIDACFSGRSRSGETLVPGAQPFVPTNMSAQIATGSVVLTAGTSDQFAGSLPGADRPAFSYLMLGALRGWGDQNGDSIISAAEAIAYTRRALMILVLDRSQTPQLAAGEETVMLTRRAREPSPDLAKLANRAQAPSPQPALSGPVNSPGLVRAPDPAPRAATAPSGRMTLAAQPATAASIASLVAPTKLVLNVREKTDIYDFSVIHNGGTARCQKVKVSNACRLNVQPGELTLSGTGTTRVFGSRMVPTGAETVNATVVARRSSVTAGVIVAVAGAIGTSAGLSIRDGSDTRNNGMLGISVGVFVLGLVVIVLEAGTPHRKIVFESGGSPLRSAAKVPTPPPDNQPPPFQLQ